MWQLILKPDCQIFARRLKTGKQRTVNLKNPKKTSLPVVEVLVAVRWNVCPRGGFRGWWNWPCLGQEGETETPEVPPAQLIPQPLPCQICSKPNKPPRTPCSVAGGEVKNICLALWSEQAGDPLAFLNAHPGCTTEIVALNTLCALLVWKTKNLVIYQLRNVQSHICASPVWDKW